VFVKRKKNRDDRDPNTTMLNVVKGIIGVVYLQQQQQQQQKRQQPT